MTKIPESRNIKQVRKTLLATYSKSLSLHDRQTLHWRVLDRLIEELDDGSEVFVAARRLSSEKNILGYLDLQQLTADPTEYGSAAQYFGAAVVTSFLKKFPFGKVEGVDPERKALERFSLAERRCRITNRRLRWYRLHGLRLEKKRPGLHALLQSMARDVLSLLGPEPDYSLVLDQVRHGPGGAIGCTGDASTAYYKFAATRYSVSPAALPLAFASITPAWARYLVDEKSSFGDPYPTLEEVQKAFVERVEVISHNKVTFVPKDAKTHRSIAIEPFFNVYCQLGVGSVLRKQLRRWGINLNSQAKNQSLAHAGSTDHLPIWSRPATLDVSMASDTMAIELVREILPPGWFNLLNRLRSPQGLMANGEQVRWAKFSSMGNGFTFELESLIFSAACRAVMRELGGFRGEGFSVYGDDLIVPVGCAARLTELLHWIGFRINTDKSFYFGPFRESCGTDWFEGVNVRPFFLDREIRSAKDLVFVANSLRLHFLDSHRGLEFREVPGYRFVTGRLPSIIANVLLGPPQEDFEGHLHVSLDAAARSPLVQWDAQLQCWSFPSVKATAIQFGGRASARYLQLLYYSRNGRDSSGDFSLNGGSVQWLALARWARELPASKTSITRRGFSRDTGNTDVVRRNATSLTLTTLPFSGWR